MRKLSVRKRCGGKEGLASPTAPRHVDAGGGPFRARFRARSEEPDAEPDAGSVGQPRAERLLRRQHARR